jgi:HEAT repeat protein
MALKVIRKREVGEAADAAASLTGDEVTRVRVAAIRALALVGEGEHADVVREAIDDPEPPVRNAALSSIETMSRRLERPL